MTERPIEKGLRDIGNFVTRYDPYGIITVILFLSVLYSSVFLFVTVFRNQETCPPSQDQLDTTPTWTIDQSTIPAQVLWQRSQPQREPLVAPLGSGRNGWIAADSTSFVYGRFDVEANCKFSTKIAALDPQTGQQVWRRDASNTIHRINSVTNGYVISYPSGVYFIDHSGERLWRNGRDLPNRSAEAVYELDGELYVPSRDHLTRLSLQTGEVIEKLDMPNVHGFFEDVAVVSISGNTLEVANTGSRDWENFTVSYHDRIDLHAGSYIDQIAYLHEDVLVIYASHPFNTIWAYDVTTGAQLWALNEQFMALPILLDDKVIILTPALELEMYDIFTGDFLGFVQIENRAHQDDKLARSDVLLAGEENRVAIYFSKYHEVIGIEFEAPG